MLNLLHVGMLLLVADKPDAHLMPDALQLRQKALINMRDSAVALERYSCSIDKQSMQLDENGRVKKTESQALERFFVNGVQVNHVLARDGKPLQGAEARKEQERTNKEARKFSDPEEARKVEDKRERQFDMFLRAQRLTNGRREARGGRSTLVYDLVGDDAFHARTIEERFAQAVGGRVWIDEESGAPVELKIQTTRDVKIGGGFLANLHKGFELHLIRARQPDGLWLTKLIEGTADLRAGLFFHPRLRFTEQSSGCHLFSVDSLDQWHGLEGSAASKNPSGKSPN